MEEKNKDDIWYQQYISQLKEMRKFYKTLTDFVSELVERQYELKYEIIEAVLKWTPEEINALPVEEIREFLVTHAINENRYKEASDEEIFDTIKIVKDKELDILEAQNSIKEIEENSKDVINEMSNYYGSEKFVNSRKVLLEKYKKEYEEMDKNPTTLEGKRELKEIERMINTLDNALSFEFVLNRLKTYKEKEVDSIIEGYFNRSRGEYIIKRFKDRIRKFGYNDSIFHFFYNIEENFLEEEYHHFNNLFLYVYMRCISYMNPDNSDDVMLVKAITSAMSNLIYHKFPDTEQEKAFVEVVKRADDFFVDYSDMFKEYNRSYKENKIRKADEERHRQERVVSLTAKLKELDVDVSDDPEKEDPKHLNELLMARIDELSEKNLSSKKRLEEPEDKKVEEPEENTSNVFAVDSIPADIKDIKVSNSDNDIIAETIVHS